MKKKSFLGCFKFPLLFLVAAIMVADNSYASGLCLFLTVFFIPGSIYKLMDNITGKNTIQPLAIDQQQCIDAEKAFFVAVLNQIRNDASLNK